LHSKKPGDDLKLFVLSFRMFFWCKILRRAFSIYLLFPDPLGTPYLTGSIMAFTLASSPPLIAFFYQAILSPLHKWHNLGG